MTDPSTASPTPGTPTPDPKPLATSTPAPLFSNPEPKPADSAATTTPSEPAKPPTELAGEKPKEEAKPNPLLGAPAEGKYEAFKLPDGYVADEPMMTEFSKAAAEIGLSQPGAQKLVDLYAGIQAKNTEAWNTQVKTWGETAKADPEYGGAKYAENLNVARGAIEKFGTPALKEQLDFSGFGNHPEFIRFAYKVGKALSEATVTGGATPGAEPKNAAEILFGGKT